MPAGQRLLPAGGMLRGYRYLDDRTISRITVLLVVLAALFLLDILTTGTVLRMGGTELNPFMAGIVISPSLHLAVKAVVLLVVLHTSVIAEVRMKGAGTAFCGILIVLYMTIVIHNLLFVLQQPVM